MKVVTITIMVGSALVWIAWDAFLSSKGQQTESQIIAAFSHISVTFPFIFGYWLGHLFANRTNVGSSNWYYVLPLLFLLASFDILWYDLMKSEMTWFRYPVLWLVMGIPVGSFLWGQSL